MNRGRAATGLLAVALAAAPAYVVRGRIGPLPTTLLEVLLLLAIVAGLVALRLRLPWRSPYALSGLLLLVGASLGVLVSPDRTGALGEWKAFFIEPALAGLVAAGLVAGQAARARVLLAGLGVSGAVAALVNLGLDLPRILAGRFSVATPPVAIYQNANQLALYAVPLDALALALLLFGRERVERVAAAAFLLVTVPAVLLTYSRGGILALAVSALCLVLLHPRRRALALPLLAVLALGVALLPGIRRRIEAEVNLSDPANSVTPRLGLWRGTLNVLERHPLTGAGLRGFDRAVAPYYHDPFQVAFPHDIVLNFWTETGLFGLAGFVWLSLSAAAASVRGLGGAGLVRALSAGLLGFLIAIWVHGLVDVPYFKNDLALAFWAVLGVHSGLARSLDRA